MTIEDYERLCHNFNSANLRVNYEINYQQIREGVYHGF